MTVLPKKGEKMQHKTKEPTQVASLGTTTGGGGNVDGRNDGLNYKKTSNIPQGPKNTKSALT